MPPSTKFRDTGCPIAFALDIFGDRWTLIVIRDMLMKNFRTYGQFLESDEKIATNILADRLRQLEAAGIVTRERDPENRRKVLYRLTEKGAELAPVMIELIRWSAKYDPNTFVPGQLLDRIRKDREGFAEELETRALSVPPEEVPDA